MESPKTPTSGSTNIIQEPNVPPTPIKSNAHSNAIYNYEPTRPSNAKRRIIFDAYKNIVKDMFCHE